MGEAERCGADDAADDALATADAWHRQGRGVAIATVVATWGRRRGRPAANWRWMIAATSLARSPAAVWKRR